MPCKDERTAGPQAALLTAARAALLSQAQAQAQPPTSAEWACGVTCSPARAGNGMLARTLASLARAGFDRPRLFVDGGPISLAAELRTSTGLEVTHREPALMTVGNWLAAALELLIRHPTAGRLAIFQDDLLMVRNARAYLDAAEWPESGYLNLFSFRENDARTWDGGSSVWRDGVILGRRGWVRAAELPESDTPPGSEIRFQKGRGAVALAFTREGMHALLRSAHPWRKIADVRTDQQGYVMGQKTVDGCIVTAMNLQGWSEWVHAPSLVQHLGIESTIGNHGQQQAGTFPGEDFDALEWLKK